jgi:hypothetical protein
MFLLQPMARAIDFKTGAVDKNTHRSSGGSRRQPVYGALATSAPAGSRWHDREQRVPATDY